MALSDNIWWTRKSRIQAEKRLLSNAFQSQLLLLWYSFFSVAVSVYYLKFNDDALGNISWIVYSVLVLCISGFISGLSFKERAGLIKDSYETLNTFYQKAKTSNPNIDQISAEYEQIMGLCENHIDYDYYRALCIEHVTSSKKSDPTTGIKEGLDRCPTWYHWLSITWWSVKRFAVLTVLYLVPIFLLLAIKVLV